MQVGFFSVILAYAGIQVIENIGSPGSLLSQGWRLDAGMTSGRWDDGFVPDHIIRTYSFARMTGEELSVYYSDSLEDGNRGGPVIILVPNSLKCSFGSFSTFMLSVSSGKRRSQWRYKQSVDPCLLVCPNSTSWIFSRHPRERGDPGDWKHWFSWIPAFAGMTSGRRDDVGT